MNDGALAHIPVVGHAGGFLLDEDSRATAAAVHRRASLRTPSLAGWATVHAAAGLRSG
ncbi:hypothetical protein [Nocardia cyriacigeorgica]|uniref:hypothetical protein n=1 Tax=Nocardia cyriacigeorgica TaxID=135487 RepID=UPI001486B0F1|nr:hypothetical protein [Nocardia cyriacigeorgica]